MSTESCPVPLRRLLGHSQTAQRRKEVHPPPVAENTDHPTAPEQHPSPTTNTELRIHSVNPVPSLPTTSPLYRLTAAGIYPLPSHTTATSSSTLPQSYMRPAPAVAGLLSHGFNPNAFLGELPQSSATAFVGSNTTRRKKASILRMTLGDRQAPVCHILIYPFVSPHHYIQAEKHNYPHVQRGYTLPQSDTYNLEQTDIEPFRAHMQKLGLCIMYRPTSNDTYKDIHAQLLAYNADGTNPQIPGLKTDNLNHLTFDNMGWCFLQLLTRKLDNTLLTFNKNIKQTQFNLSYMIQYASLESKFDGHRRRKYLATPGQFTIVIAPTTAPICHNLLNQHLYVADYGPNGIPDAARNAVHACFAEWAMHNLSFVMRRRGGSGDENDMPVEGGIPRCPVVFVNPNRAGELVENTALNHRSKKRPALSRLPSPHASPVRGLSPITPVELQPFPLPRPYYTGLVWPAPDCAELAHRKHFPSFYAQMVDHMDTMGDNTMILKGPDIGALADAVIVLCIYYAQTAWDDEKQVFHQSIEDWQGPQFQSSEITCDNWSEPARFGQMRIFVDRCRSYGEGINKMVFREALIKALRDTDLYVNLPNNSAYFTAKFPMTGCTTRQTIQWRAQGLLLTLCTVTFRMPPLPISLFLFLALIVEKRHLPRVLDALTGPVVKALDPACEVFMQPWLGRRLTDPLTSEPPSNWGRDPRYLWITHFCEPHLTALEVGFQTPDSEKAILQNRLVLRLILLSHPLAEQSDSFNALRQGFAFNFGHASYTGGLPSLIQSGYPSIQDEPETLLEYLESIYDRKIHSIDALMDVIQIDTGLVATDTFCSKRCDWGFGKDPNGHDLPMYISAKKAFEAALRTYFEHDLNGRGTRFLEIATSLPYMPCGGSSIKIQFQPPDYDDPPSQTFRTSTCFTLVKIKLDVALCGLLASSATDVFHNWTTCLDFWLSDTTNTVTIL
ncbi:hypothetical protein EDD18DRAFT_1368563 [Armillaria luteobubalina]|uniref:Uncharacterized protein n=1 Tax=Armillaria luteobubalina TaxID=153913 RepID=A0AA39UCN0_9AGAR|nr:hypothetical protein EDD18DRAFT_1368563 [Armillaria luteobubalina]